MKLVITIFSYAHEGCHIFAGVPPPLPCLFAGEVLIPEPQMLRSSTKHTSPRPAASSSSKLGLFCSRSRWRRAAATEREGEQHLLFCQ